MLLKRHFLKMRPQIFDAQTDVTVYNGRMAAAPVLFPTLGLIQGYQVRFITLVKTVTPHHDSAGLPACRC